MARPKSERGITVVIGVSHAHPPSVGTSAASAARTQARPLVRRFTEFEATGAPTAPQGARYAASERSVWRRTLAPRSIASQSLISSTGCLRRPWAGMKTIPAWVIAARFCASWPAAECRRVDRRPSAEHARSIASWTRAEQPAGVVADIGWISTSSPRRRATLRARATARRSSRASVSASGPRISWTSSPRAGGRPALGSAGACEAGRRLRVDEPLAVDGCHRLDPREVEPTAEGARAEEAPVAAFLVAPRCDGERAAVRGVGLTDRLERLEPRQDAERAVEDAALGHRVDVRAREHRGSVGPERAESEGAEDVARAVHPRLEPRGGELPREPGARLFVLRRPARARHARAGQGAEAGERLDP